MVDDNKRALINKQKKSHYNSLKYLTFFEMDFTGYNFAIFDYRSSIIINLFITIVVRNVYIAFIEMTLLESERTHAF